MLRNYDLKFHTRAIAEEKVKDKDTTESNNKESLSVGINFPKLNKSPSRPGVNSHNLRAGSTYLQLH